MDKTLYDGKDKGKKGLNEGIQGDSENLVQRDEFGRLLPGSKLNPSGISPHKDIHISTDALLESLREAEEAHKKPIMRHIWDVAYKDNKFLAKVMDKFIANKGVDLGKFTGAGQFNVIIQTYSGQKGDKPVNIDITPDQGDAESKE